MEKVNVAQHLSRLQDSWGSLIVGEMNDTSIKLEKLQGEYPWQQNDQKDELLFVVKGRLLLMYHERNIWVEAGEFIVVPKGVSYKLFIPNGDCHLLAIEPKKFAALKRCS
ncbi:cupin domain-containing protein [Brevibacillus brevis]|uniref:Cupin domain-containing protein n=1 Tax=Brevibacillus brevis TaxID=1393 RepID=A0A2Z4MN47_BREBE|nr:MULTISPECIES: cupin domain-containing protein [Brevibacillus]AWX57945.1 cupin domain-containing protein [Brevibacillus brevis]MED1783507.1 cupin domain-containing protein [Brevibacillus fortis]